VNFLDLKIAAARKRRNSGAFHTELFSERTPGKFGLILDSEDVEIKESFERLKEEMGVGDRDFHLITCKEKRLKNDIFQGPVFTGQDLSWNGKITNGEVDLFLEQQYHLLICFTEEENKLASLLVSLSKAALKAGNHSATEGNIFDLSISAGRNEPKLFIEELKKYLKIIKKQAG
jgi:hypothetical protein